MLVIMEYYNFTCRHKIHRLIAIFVTIQVELPMENAEVKMVESRICIQQTIGSLSIVPLMVPGVNHALQELLFTIKNVDNVKLLEMDLVLDQVRKHFFKSFLYSKFTHFPVEFPELVQFLQLTWKSLFIFGTFLENFHCFLSTPWKFPLISPTRN